MVRSSASCAGFSEGDNGAAHLHHGASGSKAGIGTTETPVLTLHNSLFWQGVPNRKRIKIVSATASVDGTKPSTLRMRKNGILIAANYSPVEADSSVAEKDTAATSITGGDEQFTLGMAKSDSGDFEIGEDYHINPDDRITITAEATSGSVDVVCSFNWEEDY